MLSTADPKRAMLWTRGVPVPEYGYEGTVALLWQGFADGVPTRTAMAAALGAARVAAFAALPDWLAVAASRPMDEAVRRCLAELDDAATPVAIAATLSVGVPALIRARQGAAPVSPDAALGTAADVLRMTHDTTQNTARVAALDAYFTAMRDSGLDASSFVARVRPGRSLPANLQIAAALLLDALGFPREAFIAVFAVGRAPGWLAQAMEQ